MSLHKELGMAKHVPPEKVEIQTLQTRKCHLGLAGSEGSRASSGTHFTAENVQTTSDVEILKVKEPMNVCVLIPKVNYALVKAALQTVPEELADSGFLVPAVLGMFCSQCRGRMQELGITQKYPQKGTQ